MAYVGCVAGALHVGQYRDMMEKVIPFLPFLALFNECTFFPNLGWILGHHSCPNRLGSQRLHKARLRWCAMLCLCKYAEDCGNGEVELLRQTRMLWRRRGRGLGYLRSSRPVETLQRE